MEQINLYDGDMKTPDNKSHKGFWAIFITLVIILVTVVVVVINFAGRDEADTSIESSSYSTYLTYSNYTQIKDGMTYWQVVEILDGHYGELSSSYSYSDTTIKIYSWSNYSETKSITVGFNNNRVYYKSQYGL